MEEHNSRVVFRVLDVESGLELESPNVQLVLYTTLLNG